MRKNIFNSTVMILDYDIVLRELLLKRNRADHGRRYSVRAAYDLAKTIIREIETGNYNGVFEVSSDALAKIREYEKHYIKTPFEVTTPKTIEATV